MCLCVYGVLCCVKCLHMSNTDYLVQFFDKCACHRNFPCQIQLCLFYCVCVVLRRLVSLCIHESTQ